MKRLLTVKEDGKLVANVEVAAEDLLVQIELDGRGLIGIYRCVKEDDSIDPDRIQIGYWPNGEEWEVINTLQVDPEWGVWTA